MENSNETLHCVKCAKATLVKDGEKSYRCSHCDFTYFHNVAAAACAFIVYNNKILLLERAQEPGKGKLDIPGGFVDYHESNEQALVRELMEELQLSVSETEMSYFNSYPNQYLYKNVVYHTLDSFFEIKLVTEPILVLQQSEVSDYHWVDLAMVNFEDLAFDSSKQALTLYLK